jgi:mono/diheme cytochrome c family protein
VSVPTHPSVPHLRSLLRALGVAALIGLAAAAGGCARGQPRERRPTVIIPDLEFQKKYKAQSENPLFADHRSMRTPPEGTVAVGDARTDDAYYRGRVQGDTTFVTVNPREITPELLERGRNRFNIYCSPCHDRTGSAKGIVIGYGFVPPPSFHTDRVRAFADGYIFNVITNGVRNMPSYGKQIPVGDRWAIVAYLRALQRSENATLADVPPDARDELK